MCSSAEHLWNAGFCEKEWLHYFWVLIWCISSKLSGEDRKYMWHCYEKSTWVCLKGIKDSLKYERRDTLTNTGRGKSSCRVLGKLGTNRTLLHAHLTWSSPLKREQSPLSLLLRGYEKHHLYPAKVIGCVNTHYRAFLTSYCSQLWARRDKQQTL